jgi:DNA excision repair protein ERCC-4
MRIIWSPSLSATADIFSDLKRNNPQPRQPSPPASALPDSGSPARERARNAMEVLRSLPGLTSEKAQTISRHVRSLRDLSQCTLDDLQDMIGDGAVRLYHFLQSSCS